MGALPKSGSAPILYDVLCHNTTGMGGIVMKYVLYIVVIVFTFSLAACGNKGLKDDDVFTQVEVMASVIESYHTDAEISLKITDLSSHDVVQSYHGVVKINLIESTMEGSGEVIEDGNGFQFYSTKAASYEQMDDGTWQDVSDQQKSGSEATTLYTDVAQIIADLKEEEDVKVGEKDGEYLITFAGKSESVFKAFEGPYNLELTGATPEEMNQDVMVIIDNQSFFIKQITNTLTVEKDGHELQIFVNQQYEKVNEIDDITVPQEVMDEAI